MPMGERNDCRFGVSLNGTGRLASSTPLKQKMKQKIMQKIMQINHLFKGKTLMLPFSLLPSLLISNL